MRDSFDKAFELVIGLEGDYSNDKDDPGGETKYGICKKYNPTIYIPDLTVEQAKQIYLNKYWLPNDLDDVSFPLDICLFDGAVNPQNDHHWPGAGNAEIMAQKPENWQEFLIFRMVRYMHESNAKYVKGHLFRVLRLFEQLRSLK